MNKTSLPQLRRPVPDIHEKPSSQSVERLLKQHNEKYNKLLQDVNEGYHFTSDKDKVGK